MKKCKHRDCDNMAVEGKKYCKYHIALKEERFKKGIGALTTVAGAGLVFMSKHLKDYIKK